MKNLETRILERLTTNSYKAFVFEDIKDLATEHYLKSTFCQLKKTGIFKNITKEVYDFIDLDKSFGITTSLASCEDVANALTRKYGWKIIPTSDYAMYLFQIGYFPSEYKYLSTGPSCQYSVYNVDLIFEHIDEDVFNRYSYNTLLVLQVIKAIGIRNMTENKLLIISSLITPEEKQLLLKETTNEKKEYYQFIQFICEH